MLSLWSLRKTNGGIVGGSGLRSRNPLPSGRGGINEVNGQILFNPRHVGTCLDLTESTVRDHIRKMSGKQVVKVTNSAVDNIDIRKFNSMGENFLTEAGVYKLIFKSGKPEAERFQDWVTDVVLPSIRKTGSYASIVGSSDISLNMKFDMGMSALETASRLLRMSDVSKLACLKNLCEAFAVPIIGLPKYLPRETQILSATELLKRNGKPMTVHAFNFKMLSEGLLEIQTRPSTSGSETRRFKALTEEGKAYGENSVNPDYPLETQPHYFSDKFSELLERLNKTVLSDD